MTAWPLAREAIFIWRAKQASTKRRGLFTSANCVKRPPKATRLNGSPYSTVTVKVELDVTDPEAPASPAAGVAVIVAVDVTGLVVELLEVPPQPETKPRPANSTTSSTSMVNRLRFLKPRKQSATARVAGKSGLKSWRTTAAVAGGVMVSVVVTVVPSGKPVVEF